MKTVSLELAKQLKESGYPQEGYFWWVGDKENNVRFNLANYDASETMDSIAAPTADEILDVLPDLIKDRFGQEQYLSVIRHNGWANDKKWVRHDSWEVFYTNIFSSNYQGEVQSLADAAAKMWLYLKKEKLI